MKVIFVSFTPCALAHGGLQIQIEQTKAALESIGVEVEWLRWWDETQTGDILHIFGRGNAGLIALAQRKGFRVIIAPLLGDTGSRPMWKHWLLRFALKFADWVVPRIYRGYLPSGSYQSCDKCFALSEREAFLMRFLHGVNSAKLHVVPNGVEDFFFSKGDKKTDHPWYVSTVAIIPRKRPLELAQAAIIAKVPVWIIGKPFSEDDPYFKRFLEIAKANPDYVRYEGPIYERKKLAEIYRGARGFILISSAESLSLSALEAAAANNPLFLTDLPWAHFAFGEKAIYCPDTNNVNTISIALQSFAQTDHTKIPRFIPLRWREVAEMIRDIYQTVLEKTQY